jgi:hypothetical protein
MVTKVTNIHWLLRLRECGLPVAFRSADISFVVSLNDLHEWMDMQE